jgi:PAS domain S-box-containing protein
VFDMDEAEEIVGFGVWTWDIDSGVVQWSDALRRIYGLEPGMFGGTPEAFVAFLHPDDRERVWALISRAVSEVGEFAFEERIVRADGEERTLLSRGHALTNGQHNVRVVGVCQDDTDQRDAARALGHSERRMRAIIDNTPSIVAVKDLDGTYLMANRETAVVLGAHPDDVIGRKCAELFPADIAERLLAADRRAAAEGTAVYDEAVLYRNGEPRDYLTVTFPLPDAEGRPVETCTIGTDVTEIRRLESRRRERIEWGGRLTAAVNENRLLAYAQPVVDVITGDAFANEMLVRARSTSQASRCVTPAPARRSPTCLAPPRRRPSRSSSRSPRRPPSSTSTPPSPSPRPFRRSAAPWRSMTSAPASGPSPTCGCCR